jgi:predicted TIM-barrel fold metal-dependent hydrolase
MTGQLDHVDAGRARSETSPIPIVDGHFHLWTLEDLEYPWLAPGAPPRPFGDHGPIKKTYGPAEYRSDWNDLSVVASVHVQANCADPRGETRWLVSCAERTGIPAAIVAYADLTAEDVEQKLEELAGEPLVRGVRMMLNWHADPARRAAEPFDLMQDESFRRGFSLLHRHGLSFDLGCLPSQLGMACELADANPGTAILLNHLGWPLLADEDGEATWRKGMIELARRPNVFLKVSGLWPIDRHWNPGALRGFVCDAIGWFGFERCLYGSNFPIEKLMTSMPQQIQALVEILNDAAPADLEALFSGTARRAYRLQLNADGRLQ